MFWKFFRRNDPFTSAMAAESIDHGKLEDVVYLAIKGFGEKGCISDDVCNALPYLHSNTVTPRYRKLINRNLVVVTGETRKGLSGRSQRVMRCA